MPSGRQFKVIALVVLLTVLVLYYFTNGEKLTHSSEFYKKTVAVIEQKKSAEARQHVIEEERQRLDRVERVQKEHDVAMASATTEVLSAATKKPIDGPGIGKQQPIVESEADKSVAGRKKAKDGKVVEKKPASDNDDGVAKVGNGASKSSGVAEEDIDPETEAVQKVERELNNILKKGPIIIFSKSGCPYSRKAKHILLENYTITPTPHVVELDRHDLGPGLQDALLKSTGRRTVPNILINGKSIGGGDDIEALHRTKTLIETVQTMGGKRIVSIVAEDPQKVAQRAEVKFKA